MELLISFVFFVLMLGIGGGLGRRREQRHLRDLDVREAATSTMLVTNLRTVPAEVRFGGGALVLGEVVVANDYLKAFLAKLRGIFGGEVRSYQALLTRGRREARLRMLEQARALGATTVINLRYQMSEIGGSRSSGGDQAATTEVLCFGTALLPPRF